MTAAGFAGGLLLMVEQRRGTPKAGVADPNAYASATLTPRSPLLKHSPQLRALLFVQRQNVFGFSNTTCYKAAIR